MTRCDPRGDVSAAPRVLGVCVLTLIALGVVMVQSASMSVGDTGFWTDRGHKHACYAVAAVCVYLLAGRVPLRWLLRPRRSHAARWHAAPSHAAPAVLLLALAGVLSLLVLVPGVGTEVNGARRWLRVGPVQVQPSELCKWACIVWIAWAIGTKRLDVIRFWRGLVPAGGAVALAVLLVVIEDFGTAALIATTGFAMLLAGGARPWHLLLVAPPALAAATYFVAGTPYRLRRMTAFLDPFADPRGDGYHMVQSLLGFAGGGFTGTGLGNGVQKLGYLPEDTTDFIFSVIAEELGLAGSVLVVLLMAVIVSCAISAVRSTRLDDARKLLALGIGFTVGLQALINVGVATVSLPTKGMSLPLVSAGGTGLLMTAAALGLLSRCLKEADAEPTDSRDDTRDAARYEDDASRGSPASAGKVASA
jgi:cell division protein FtsW